MDSTDKLILISVIESILTDEDTYLDFINQEGDFSNINVDEYLPAINNYMKYILNKTSGESEELFIRANNINARYDTGIRYEYLCYMLNTTNIINIGIIENILNDEDIFNRFMNFSDNIDFFGDYLIGYLSSIWEYVSYMRERNLALSNEAINRYNLIVREYSLDYKRASILTGEYIEDEMDEEFADSILRNVDMNRSKFHIALDIYKELCKRCTYDPSFFALDQDMQNPISANIYSKSVLDINDKNNKVVCKTWAILYQDLLKRCGFQAQVDGKFHKFVVFNCDGTLIKADGTNSVRGRKDQFYLNDLTRSKLGMPVSGFVCLEPDKDINKFLEENDEFIVEHENNLETLANEYRSRFLSDKSISFVQMFEVLNKKAINTNLKDLDLVKYIDSLYRVMLLPFTNIQKSSNYIAIRDGMNSFKVSYLISIVTDTGEYNYYLFNKGRGFLQMKREELINLINSQQIIISGKRKDVLGIKEETTNEYTK